jgi:hypothetical protein
MQDISQRRTWLGTSHSSTSQGRLMCEGWRTKMCSTLVGNPLWNRPLGCPETGRRIILNHILGH